jgi:hypothetical protein
MNIRGKSLSVDREDTPNVIGFRYGKNGGCRWNETTMVGAQGERCGWCGRTAWVTDLDKRSCDEFGKVSYLR